jgi:hypothetical protein
MYGDTTCPVIAHEEVDGEITLRVAVVRVLLLHEVQVACVEHLQHHLSGCEEEEKKKKKKKKKKKEEWDRVRGSSRSSISISISIGISISKGRSNKRSTR